MQTDSPQPKQLNSLVISLILANGQTTKRNSGGKNASPLACKFGMICIAIYIIKQHILNKQ